MKFNQLVQELGFSNKKIIATLIKSIRNSPIDYPNIYQSGEVVGFKPSIWGRKNDSHGWSGPHELKKARVLVVYNIADWGKKCHSDWVEVDNCTFEIIIEK